ncbi:MAG: SpoVG family protein [Candidatus Faecivicinus sp.]
MENQNVASIEAQVYPLKEARGNTLAMTSLTIGGCFAVRGVKVVQGRNGPFVSMPQAKDGKGGYQDICFPISREVREQVSKLVLDKYNAQLDKAQPQNAAPQRNPNHYPSRNGSR